MPACPRCAGLAVRLGKAPDGSYAGYVEGEVIYLAAPLAGYLDTLPVMRGARVAQGAQVFTVAAEPEQQGLREAQAREISAREKVANLSEPRRQSEVAAIEAQLRAAEAALRLSGQQLQQQEALLAKAFISAASVDAARAAKARDQAQVDAAREQLATFRATLGRQPEVRAAQADVEAAAAQVAQRKWQVDKKVVIAQVPGEITETYYRPGEWVAAGAPVAQPVPDARRRVRFFVPETAIATLKPGQKVEARCDGCLRRSAPPSTSSRRRLNTRRRSSTAAAAAKSSFFASRPPPHRSRRPRCARDCRWTCAWWSADEMTPTFATSCPHRPPRGPSTAWGGPAPC